jgi:NAD(P)-dependent dehydrogenase (short-subunit alcohol dehydrogenase family)
MPSVLITGANRGIGLEFARQYSLDGWEVTGTARDLDTAKELVAIAGVRAEQLDMADIEAVAGFGERIAGPLDLLIANAGTYQPESVETAEDARGWARMMIVNAIGPYVLARSLLTQVAEARGKLIAISSDMGSIASNRSGSYVPYRSSKSALNSAWRSLAIEARPRGIIVAAFNPGWVKTRMGGPNATLRPEQSIGEMRALIDGLGPEQSGGFFERDGRVIPW